MTSKRIEWFDNSKGILIFLVVFGHLIESYRQIHGNQTILWLYNTIYTFHMPLFIIISGYFFREGRVKKVIQFMGIFLIWQLIDGFLTPLISSHTLPSFTDGSRLFKLLIPYWTLWFLMGMIIWRMVTPYFLKLRFPILIAIGLAIWSSYVPDLTSWFSLRKILTFYPFYLIGYWLAQKGSLNQIMNQVTLRPWRMRLVAGGIFLSFIVFMAFYTKWGYIYNTQQMFARYAFKDMDWSILQGSLYSLIYYGCVTLLCLSILILIPINKKLFILNRFGYYSLFIYLLHSNCIRILRAVMSKGMTHHPEVLIPSAFVLAFLICWTATSKPIMALFSRLIEPEFNWLMSKSIKTKPTKTYGLNYNQ
ncbi:acyltransferase family protein [Pullulanibacillus sp. KACC 23026]|uniref:acyltransferase family protein n=1 Tax=Pullulanibacillus sp. KACC 23026 TaxID=3028315 RepID=UPI0023AF151F|nr:acyltransferase family protein [Pullulanibacillus sp. KACC 23026]WEG14674.1 acyltransferase family protein [Pullulanibacillus sp. KACC 23026]